MIAFVVVWKMWSLENGQKLFLGLFLVFCVLMIGVVPNGGSEASGKSLFQLIGKNAFQDALAGRTLEFGNLAATDVFSLSYQAFTMTAATMSTIIMAGFTISIPRSSQKLDKESIQEKLDWFRNNLNLSSLIVTIGVLQMFVWTRLPAFAVDDSQASAYRDVTRTTVLFYAAVYTLVVVSGAGVSYVFLRISTRSKNLSWRALLPKEFQQWELVTRISLPLLTAVLAGLLDNIFK